MADGKIRVKFEAEGSEALISAIKELNKQTKRLGLENKKTSKSTDKAGDSTERLGRNADKLKGSIFGLSTSLATARAKMLLYGFAVKQVIDFTKGLVDKSAKFEDISRGFNNLRMSAGMSVETFDKLNVALDGTVSSIDLMKQANNAMLLGIFKTEDEMANMFDAAQRLAQVLGQDATFGIESLVTGLGRQSKLMLDNLGIVFSAERAYVDYANALKKNVGDLTESEKKQAFLNKAMQSANELVENAGDEYLGTSAKLGQLNTSFVNARIELGEALTPVILASIDALRFMLDGMDSGRIKRWGVSIGGAALAFKLYNTSVRIAKIETISFQAIFAKTGWGTVMALIGLASGAMMEYFGIFDDGTEILKDGNEELAESERLLRAKQEQLDATMKMQREGAESLQKELDLLNAKTETEKKLINLGHEASIFESRLISSIVSKNLLMEQMNKARENRIALEKEEHKLIAANLILKQQEELLSLEVNGATLKELELAKAKINYENQLLDIGVVIEGNIIKRKDSTYKLTEAEANQVLYISMNYDHTKLLIEQNHNRTDSEIALLDALMLKASAQLEINALQDNIITRAEQEAISKQKILDLEAALNMEGANTLEITRAIAAEKNKLTAIEERAARIKLSTTSKAMKASADLIGLNAKNTKHAARLQAAAGLVDAYAAAQSQFALVSKTLPPPFPQLAFAAAIASGIAQAQQITKAANTPIFEQGGLIGGRRHSQGGTTIEAEQGEFVMSRNAVNSIGVENLNRMNDGSSGGSGATIIINNPIVNSDFVENEFSELMREAVRKGADFGIS